MKRLKISPERKAVFYLGVVVGAVGLLSFFSTFLSAALNFGDFTDFESRGRSMALRAFGGLFLLIIAAILTSVGRLGLAGSGVKLDPEKARREMEPWSRFHGGVLRDTLDEAGVRLDRLGRDHELPFDERLRRLQQLLDDQLISVEEYEATKQRILDSA